MLDEEKVKLMARIEIFEKQQEKKELKTARFFKEDYVKYGILRSLIVATLTYWIAVAVMVFLRFEEVLKKLNDQDYFRSIRTLLSGYVLVLFIFLVYAFLVYSIRYTLAKNGLIRYNRDLKRLCKIYDEEDMVNMGQSSYVGDAFGTEFDEQSGNAGGQQ